MGFGLCGRRARADSSSTRCECLNFTCVSGHCTYMNTEQVSVLYFAKSAELTGLKAEIITVPSNITSLQLWQDLETRHPRLSVLRDQVVLAVRQEYVPLGAQPLTLREGDEVAIIPPLSGG
ncbi:molybdopterin synthase sulfur carrier subunit isoform X1 [Siphateles boraxobius]|uniref:molybdopterin synthase sulfur carrier subunit isoform X1 n=1 Tax=Siphateles boraxobius TaxID=180520 RepID=UPI0040643C4C